MGKTVRQHLVSYSCAILAVIGATLLRLALAPIVGDAVPFSTFVIAAIALAWFRGFLPAAFSVLLSAFLGERYILNPGSTGQPPDRHDWAAMLGFTMISLTVSFLIDFQRRTLRRAWAAESAQASAAQENSRLLKDAELTARRLTKYNDDLKRANRDLELFAYSASHDLQEPLRTIAISAQLIQRDLPPNQFDQGLVQQINLASQRMNALIQDVLAYIGVTTMELEPLPMIDTQRVLREVLERLNGSIMASEASVTSNELPLIAMHENRLAQVLQNLISNAIKYRSTEPPRIRVEASSRDNSWEFSVSDNGMGIDPVFREHIFGLFKRLHSQAEYQGSGMGLAICQRIVEQYGGKIWLARAEPGHGSTFCFSIPIKSELESGQSEELRSVSLHTAS